MGNLALDHYPVGVVVILLAIFLSIVCQAFFTNVLGAQRLRESHEVGKYFLSIAGTLYAVLLGLVVVDAMSKFKEAEKNCKVLYGEGQAMLALVMLERALANGAVVDVFRDPAPIRATVSRAMDYVAGAYWPVPLRTFFFVEENWHCLAARAALAVHRHDGYERFCLDYVAFKSRLIVDPSDLGGRASDDGDLSGGYEWGALSVPHAAATSGFGEALAAAIDVKRARGEPTASERERLARVLGFLVRAQWTRADCFACADPAAVEGGFSRHHASSTIRLDYVQHAWAALAHGARSLRAEGS